MTTYLKSMICNTGYFVVLCTMVLLASHETLAEDFGQQVKLKPGVRAFVKSDSVIPSGPNKGELLKEGWLVACNKLDKNKVWISGPTFGWVSATDLVIFEQAEEHWKKKILAHPNDLKLLVTLAKIQLLSNKPEFALKTITKAKGIANLDTEARVVLAIISATADGLELTRNQLQELCNKKVLSDPLATFLLSFLSLRDSHLGQVVLESINVNPDKSSCGLLEQAARIALKNKDEQEAIKLLNAILERDKWSSTALLLRSILLTKFERYDEAIADAAESVLLIPNSSLAHDQLGSCYFAAGYRRKGIETLSKALELAPDNPELCYKLGTVIIKDLILRGVPIRGEAANRLLKLLKKSCELTDYSEGIYIRQLAIAYVSANEPRKADELLGYCMEKHGHDPESRAFIQETRKILLQVDAVLEPSGR